VTELICLRIKTPKQRGSLAPLQEFAFEDSQPPLFRELPCDGLADIANRTLVAHTTNDKLVVPTVIAFMDVLHEGRN
jgi:hypothetical protein